MVELDDKGTTETKTITYNFAPELAVGVTLTTPTFVKSMTKYDLGSPVSVGTGIAIGTLPSLPDTVGAATITIGTNQIVGQTVLVLIGGGMDGNQYKVVCTVSCSDGQILSSAAVFFVRDSAI